MAITKQEIEIYGNQNEQILHEAYWANAMSTEGDPFFKFRVDESRFRMATPKAVVLKPEQIRRKILDKHRQHYRLSKTAQHVETEIARAIQNRDWLALSQEQVSRLGKVSDYLAHRRAWEKAMNKQVKTKKINTTM